MCRSERGDPSGNSGPPGARQRPESGRKSLSNEGFGHVASGYRRSMTHYTDPTTDGVTERDVVYTDRPGAHTTADPVYRTDDRPVIVDRPSRVPAFVAGFLSALVLAAASFVVFLVVSDSDDDGNVDVEVPAVQVDENG